jgi:hypothetical protein
MNGKRPRKEVVSGEHHRRTEGQMVLGGFAIVLVVGGLLTLLLLGQGPATLAVGVILVAAGVLLAVYKGFELVELWLKKSEEQ